MHLITSCTIQVIGPHGTKLRANQQQAMFAIRFNRSNQGSVKIKTFYGGKAINNFPNTSQK